MMASAMGRFFNTAGPCNPRHHYMLPWEERGEVEEMDAKGVTVVVVRA